MTVLLLPLRGQPDSPQWGVAQDEWNARHILGPPTADGVFREPPPPPGQPTAAQAAVHTIQVPGFFSAKVAWWENRWARKVGAWARKRDHDGPVPCRGPMMRPFHAHCRPLWMDAAVWQAAAIIHPFFHVARVLHWDEVGLEWHVGMRFVGMRFVDRALHPSSLIA